MDKEQIKNQVIDELVPKDEGRIRKIASKDIVNTCMMFFDEHHLSTSHQKMSFEKMPYLLQIYFDESPEIIIMSSVQTGKSEWALMRGFACMDLGLNVFHVFSTGEAKYSFVKGRIDELCDSVEAYKKMENDDRRNKYLRSIGKANWKFVISNSKSHFDEFPADVAIVDEYDSCNTENIGLIGTRLENSKYKFKYYIGNPTVENTGLAKFYLEGKQYEWHFKCVRCKSRIKSDFFKCVVKEIKDKDGNHVAFQLYDKEWNGNLDRDIMIRCGQCNFLQQRENNGFWVAKNPNAKISSYQISKLIKLSSPIREIWEELKTAEGNEGKMQIFYNKKLGRPYSGTGSKVTKEMLDKLVYDYTARDVSSKPCIAGMDVGEKFDLQIDMSAKHDGKRKKLLINAFRCSSLDDVKEKIEIFNIRTMCVGIKPERHLMQKFRNDMMGICDVILIEELDTRTGNLKLTGFQENEDLGMIKVDRTWMLDESMKNIKLGFNIIPKGYEGLLDGYWLDSVISITRIYQNEREEYKWSKADNDHFRFADAFSMIAWMQTQEAVMFAENKSEVPKEIKRTFRKNYSDSSLEMVSMYSKHGLRSKRGRNEEEL
jgi:hypothetical protein